MNMRMRYVVTPLLGLVMACAENSLTAPHEHPTPTLDVLYSRIHAAGRRSEVKYGNLVVASQSCLFAATHVDGSFQGISVPRMLLPFHLSATRRQRGKPGNNELATVDLAVPGTNGKIHVSCTVPSKGSGNALLSSIQVDPANPKWHMILLGVAQSVRHARSTAPPVSDEVSAVRREMLGYKASNDIEIIQAAEARMPSSAPVLVPSADCIEMATERNATNARLLSGSVSVNVPTGASPQVLTPVPPTRSNGWTCSPGGGETWMDVLVDAVGTWAAAWDGYDFQGLTLDDGTTSFQDAYGAYYGSGFDMSVDPLWQSLQDQPYFDPAMLPDATDGDATIASNLICGSKCLTVEEFQHSTTVASYMQSLYNMSMTDPQHVEYGAYLYRDSQGRILMGSVFYGSDQDHVQMGSPPPNSIAAIHTHPTVGGPGWGDWPDLPANANADRYDPGDEAIWNNLHEIGVVVTQHRELYYRPYDGVHAGVEAGVIWAAY